jgi:hypothetical protein
MLIMDNNGKIEYGYYWEPEQYTWENDPSAWTAIFDLQTGKVVYTVPGVANLWASTIDWLNPDWLLVSTDGFSEFKPLTKVSLVDLHTPITVMPIEGGVSDLGDNRLLLHQDSGDNSQISLYDIATGKLQPITNLWDSQQYNVRIMSHGNDFEMTITDATSREGQTLADWLVHVASA